MSRDVQRDAALEVAESAAASESNLAWGAAAIGRVVIRNYRKISTAKPRSLRPIPGAIVSGFIRPPIAFQRLARMKSARSNCSTEPRR